MEFTLKEVQDKKLKIVTVKDFISKHLYRNIKVSAIAYAINNDLIDWCQPERDRFIVLTKKSMNYRPREIK